VKDEGKSLLTPESSTLPRSLGPNRLPKQSVEKKQSKNKNPVCSTNTETSSWKEILDPDPRT